MHLSPDFNAFIESCARRGVRFVLVGGYALAVHGHPRMTKDLDVDIDGVAVPVIGRRELIANKRATGRLQGLADVERLEADG